MLPARLREEIFAHAREETPKECCGLVVGRNGVATRIVRCTNASPTPEVRYSLREIRRVFEIEDDGDELVGIYHSHPRSPAYPSPTDRREAHWPSAAYVIVSLRTNDVEIHAYRIRERDVVTELELAEK